MTVRVALTILLAICFASSACNSGGNRNNSGVTPPAPGARAYGYEVINGWPHDRDAYTQGLIFHEGKLIESTGQYGRSSLRRVEIETGKVLQKVDVPEQYFAEGLTLLAGKLYQLTWEHQRGFIYDPSSFEKIGEFSYAGEGWGLTHDSESLILSDGTNRLRFIDPNTFQVTRAITVLDRHAPVSQLNELEYVKGEIFANVWHQDRIARIDPQTGKVLGWIALTGLLPRSELSNPEAVLNGIAYDDRSDRVFVTGKLWPRLFEIRIKEK